MLELNAVGTPRRRHGDRAWPSTALPLRDDTFERHAKRISVPRYARDALRPGVVHLGVGAFHRSHQAVYFDDLARLGERDWGVVGVGLRRASMLLALAPQDLAYTVVTRGTDRDDARAVGVMTRYLLAPAQGEAVLAALSDKRAALVTLTITADAYGERELPEAGRGRAPDGVPSSAVAYLVEALDRRRRRGRRPFTVLSCDNMPENGAVARDSVLAVAGARDARLAAWIDEHVAFPSSMVDRITPRTTQRDIDFVAERFGVRDTWPVMTEPFSQWVIEDNFCNTRPPLDEVGVQFVPDVAPYALMKTRLVNATHCAIGYLGSLAGLRRPDQVMSDPVFASYVTALMDREVTPLLPDLPAVDLVAYKRTLIDRLRNPKLRDDLARLCRGGSAKVPALLLSSIGEARGRGGEDRLLTLAVAAWLRYLRGTDARGRSLTVDDPLGDRLTPLAIAGGSDPRLLLSERAIFGRLAEDRGFVASLGQALTALDTRGPRGAIAACLDDERFAA